MFFIYHLARFHEKLLLGGLESQVRTVKFWRSAECPNIEVLNIHFAIMKLFYR